MPQAPGEDLQGKGLGLLWTAPQLLSGEEWLDPEAPAAMERTQRRFSHPETWPLSRSGTRKGDQRPWMYFLHN